MKITITFNTDNAAFADGGYTTEIPKILKYAAANLINENLENENLIELEWPIFDTNGNKVGTTKAEAT